MRFTRSKLERAFGLPLLIAVLVMAACASPVAARRPTLFVGAVYPLAGPQGAGGREELAGVQTAVQLINEGDGVQGKRVRLVVRDAQTAEAGRSAVDDLVDHEHVPAILGSYSSLVSVAASAEASKKGTVWWETGAVADAVTMGDAATAPPYVFRSVASGSTLGRMSARFTSEVLLPHWGLSAGEARVTIVYESDVYGRSVADGAMAEARARGFQHVDAIPYDAAHVNPSDVAQAIKAQEPDFLWDSSYLTDGIALWRAIAASGVHLKGAVGTSSAFCMPQFGATLGSLASGLYASDKPDGTINQVALTPLARTLLAKAEAAYQRDHHEPMSISALTGFVGAWAMLHDVTANASTLSPDGISAAAFATDLPDGSEINGAGLRFGRPGEANAGQNQRAAGVVWQWQGASERVVFPPAYQTAAPMIAEVPAPS